MRLIHMQLQEVTDLVANIKRNIQQIVDQVHDYLRRFVAQLCVSERKRLKLAAKSRLINMPRSLHIRISWQIIAFYLEMLIMTSSWDEFETLWTSDKTIVCEKFVSRGLPLVHIDEKLLFYTNIVERMDSIQPFHDVGPIRVNLRLLIDSIRSYAIEWKNTLGQLLIEKTVNTLRSLQTHMTVWVQRFSNSLPNNRLYLCFWNVRCPVGFRAKLALPY